MIRLASFAALMLVAAPAFAAAESTATASATAPVHRGQVLRDASGARLGVIDSVASDGSVGFILDTQYVRIPASSLTNVDGKAQTSMSKKDLKAKY